LLCDIIDDGSAAALKHKKESCSGYVDIETHFFISQK
jgi:hypothetical protein